MRNDGPSIRVIAPADVRTCEEMPPSRDNDHSALALFAAELQAARTRAGMSQDELAARISYSPSLVGMVESMRRVPRLDFAQRCDEALATTGTFARLHEHLRTAPFPSWFRPFVQHEAEAAALHWFEQTLVPGLLQTADYARALLSTRVGASDEDVEQAVSARLERQAILDRDEPPLLWVIMDEAVLRRPVGGADVMRAQVEHLAEMAGRSNVVIQVIPYSVGAHEGVNGAFVIADFAVAPSIVYLETALTGLVVERPEDVASVRLTYDTLRSEAMPRAASLDLLREVAKTWT
jgi:transcriptional regulator with XRE-family HTH domain